MAIEIFISHSHADASLAELFERFLEEISYHSVTVQRSSKEGDIEYGTSWIDWINAKVQTADITFVLLTPSSFSAKWVLWEAGAVSGVQKAVKTLRDDDSREVIPVKYNIDRHEDLGPFEGIQTTDGINPDQMVALARHLLKKFEQKGVLEPEKVFDSVVDLRATCSAHIKEVRAVLERLQISQTQDVVQEWIERLDRALDSRDYAFVRSARRWINIAFLGLGRADDRGTAIDFRLHMRLAAGFAALQEWKEARDQLTLAKSLSPRDMLVLRQLGRTELELDDSAAARRVCDQMRELDENVLTEDEEALMLSVRIHIQNGDEASALDELKEASKLVHDSAYSLNMLAILTSKVEGYAEAEAHFRALRKLETGVDGQSIWSVGNLINAALGLGDERTADTLLDTLQEMDGASENRQSISRYFDEIISHREGFIYDWKGRWPDS